MTLTIQEYEYRFEKIANSLAQYERGMASLGGCGEGHCVIQRPVGQHTNGGCRCGYDRTKAPVAMSRASYFAAEVRKALSHSEPRS